MIPQDIMIGDWLLADGKPIQVAAIHLKKVGYHERHDRLTWVRLDRLDYIKITDETLREFGFKKLDMGDGWLYDDNVYEYRSDKIKNEEAYNFLLSWTEDEYGDRRYRIICRKYGEFMELRNDSISEMQHFFYDFNHCFMPLERN